MKDTFYAIVADWLEKAPGMLQQVDSKPTLITYSILYIVGHKGTY